jgi:hypothetical protein
MYMLFGGQCYYAKGGLNDLLLCTESAQDAISYARMLEETTGHKQDGIEWWHVVFVDSATQTAVVVKRSECTPHGEE